MKSVSIAIALSLAYGARAAESYDIPDVTLQDQRGSAVSLRAALRHEGPVLLQFIFTTCTTICPVLSSTFRGVQEKLGPELGSVRMISISIDPENDTPARLAEYAKKFRASPQWVFLTGKLEDVVAVQKAFDVWRVNKMRHLPLTFLRAAPEAAWVRLEGTPSAPELLRELRGLGATAGRRIYREGLLPSGAAVRAILQGSEVDGRQFPCVSCHRPSGFGSSEGATLTPPITGPALFQPRQLDRADLFRKMFQEDQGKRFYARMRDSRPRPAYTVETLANAIRNGVDPTGRQLDPVMPRYALDASDMRQLITWLQTLAATNSPGVDSQAIHFATVVTPGVESSKRQAMLDVLNSYFRRKNDDTRRELQRPRHSPWYKDDFYAAYREWKLDVWNLTGAPETWEAQLDRYYRERPVFALLSGIGAGEWRPVHEFCEREQVPCLFPNTDVPVSSPPGAYSVYFSKGLILEAEALADFLGREATSPITQVYRRTGNGAAAAQAFRRAHPDASARLVDRAIDGDAPLTPAFWQSNPKATLVLWLDAGDFEAAPPPAARATAVYLSYTLLGEKFPAVNGELREKTLLTYPFALPGRAAPQIFRVRGWLRSRGIAPVHERIQLQTYFALSIAEDSLVPLVENFSRDYFLEYIEHEAENALNPGVYPRLSLGPGQRFASKGSYVVKLSDKAPGGIEAVGDWIVP